MGRAWYPHGQGRKAASVSSSVSMHSGHCPLSPSRPTPRSRIAAPPVAPDSAAPAGAAPTAGAAPAGASAVGGGAVVLREVRRRQAVLLCGFFV